jgi:hypothetical protein
MVSVSLIPKPVAFTVTVVVGRAAVREIEMRTSIACVPEGAAMDSARHTMRTASEHIIFTLDRESVVMEKPH